MRHASSQSPLPLTGENNTPPFSPKGPAELVASSSLIFLQARGLPLLAAARNIVTPYILSDLFTKSHCKLVLPALGCSWGQEPLSRALTKWLPYITVKSWRMPAAALYERASPPRSTPHGELLLHRTQVQNQISWEIRRSSFLLSRGCTLLLRPTEYD